MLELNLNWNRVGAGLPLLLCIPYLEALSVSDNALGQALTNHHRATGTVHPLFHGNPTEEDDGEHLNLLLSAVADILSLQHGPGGDGVPVADILSRLSSLGRMGPVAIFDDLVSAGTQDYVCCGELIFLDIANNGLNAASLQYLGEKLRLNHVLLSLHIYGNNHGECWVDARGFIQILDHIDVQRVSGIRARRVEPKRHRHAHDDISWVSAAPIRERSLRRALPRGTVCWLGQRWNEHCFTCSCFEWLLV